MKRRVAGLHQVSEIGSVDVTDVWEPKEEGLDRKETTRRVSSLTITLSKEPLDASHIGYQAPLPEDQARAGVFCLAVEGLVHWCSWQAWVPAGEKHKAWCGVLLAAACPPRRRHHTAVPVCDARPCVCVCHGVTPRHTITPCHTA
jgi:hypothetical protein